jgi:hypothetical protein
MNDQTQPDSRRSAAQAIAEHVDVSRTVQESAGVTYQTNTQQRLADEEERHAVISQARVQLKDAIAANTENVQRLQKLIKAQERNLELLEIEDASILQSIHVLRTRGIEQ